MHSKGRYKIGLLLLTVTDVSTDVECFIFRAWACVYTRSELSLELFPRDPLTQKTPPILIGR